jgi:hypothetical protein
MQVCVVSSQPEELYIPPTHDQSTATAVEVVSPAESGSFARSSRQAVGIQRSGDDVPPTQAVR